MRPIESIYEDGLLKPETPLTLKQRKRVSLLVIRHSVSKIEDPTHCRRSRTCTQEISSSRKQVHHSGVQVNEV
jgi:predicted DNA-binding antitoxin AbrB/MazE fold protein